MAYRQERVEGKGQGMTAPWTREQDALLARVAEGLEVETLDFWGHEDIGYECQPEMASSRLKNGRWCAVVSAYLTDLVAGVRAAEAYRKREKWRQWSLESPVSGHVNWQANVWSSRQVVHKGWGKSPAEALARALYAACLSAQPAGGDL